MANKFHLSPTGLKPCEATVRACKYGHVNSDGSFTRGTSIKEMAQLVEGLQNEIVKNPEDNSQYDLYYSARRNYDQALSESAGIDPEVRLNISYDTLIPRDFVLTEENYDEIKNPLIAKFTNAKTGGQIINIRKEIGGLIFSARAAEDEEQKRLKQKLVEEIIASTADEKILEMYRDVNENRIEVNSRDLSLEESWVAAAILKNPNCSDETGYSILASKTYGYDFKSQYADNVKNGWVTVANRANWAEQGTLEKEKAVKAAVSQITTGKNNSLNIIEAGNFVKTADNNPPIEVNKFIGKVNANFEPGVLYGIGNTEAVPAIMNFAAKDPASLSKANLKKLLSIARNGEHSLAKGGGITWFNPSSAFRVSILDKAIDEGKLRPTEIMGKRFKYNTTDPDKVSKIEKAYKKASIDFQKSKEDKTLLDGKYSVLRKAELAYDVINYEPLVNELMEIQKQQKRVPFISKGKFKRNKQRASLLRERVTRARTVREWEILEDYIDSLK